MDTQWCGRLPELAGPTRQGVGGGRGEMWEAAHPGVHMCASRAQLQQQLWPHHLAVKLGKLTKGELVLMVPMHPRLCQFSSLQSSCTCCCVTLPIHPSTVTPHRSFVFLVSYLPSSWANPIHNTHCTNSCIIWPLVVCHALLL